MARVIKKRPLITYVDNTLVSYLNCSTTQNQIAICGSFKNEEIVRIN